MDILLKGTIDEECQLSMLRANNLVLNKISDIIDDEYDKHIDRTSVASNINLNTYIPDPDCKYGKWKFKFPKFSGINVNMMPFRIFNCKETLPEYLHSYLPIIKSCPIFPYKFDSDGRNIGCDSDQICYLTIHESSVKKGETQRRAGIHIERPAFIEGHGRFVEEQPWGMNEFSALSWGRGRWDNMTGFPIDGIYMATNIAKSSKIYDVLIDKPEEITDKHGGLDYIMCNKIKDKSYNMEPNRLYWMTDRTPHESLPVEEDCDRQFFRLVVGKISIWYSQHNTANPLVEPDAPISDCSKF